MQKIFKSKIYLYGIFKKLIFFCYFGVYLSVRNKLNYCKNEAAGKIVKIGKVKKFFYIIVIIILFQTGVYYIKNNYINNILKFKSDKWISLTNKLYPIATVYAQDEISNKNIELTNVSAEVEDLYIKLNGYVRQSISGLSNMLSKWFDRFSYEKPGVRPSSIGTSDLTESNEIDNIGKTNEGVIIVPIGKDQDEQTIKEKLKNIISDNFTLDKVEKEGYGIIKPVFNNGQIDNQDYLFMMVPVIPAPVEN